MDAERSKPVREIEIPLGRFREYQRIMTELKHAQKIHAMALEVGQVIAENLLQKEQIHNEFLISINAPMRMAEVIQLDDYRPDDLVA